jgi:hypothetical protein
VKISTQNGNKQGGKKKKKKKKKKKGVNVVVHCYSMVILPCAEQGDQGTKLRVLKRIKKNNRGR